MVGEIVGPAIVCIITERNMARVEFRVKYDGSWCILEGFVDGKRASCRMPRYLVETMKDAELAEQLETAELYERERRQQR